MERERVTGLLGGRIMENGGGFFYSILNAWITRTKGSFYNIFERVLLRRVRF